MKTFTIAAAAFAALLSFGAAAPTIQKRSEFCYNYPHTIAGDYLAKRDLTSPADAGPVAADIAVRDTLEARSVPTHIQWCLPGSTIYVNPVHIGELAASPIARTIIEEMVLSALEAVDAYIHTHGPGFLLVGQSWNFVSPMDSRFDIHVHGATTYLVLQGGLESMLNYMQNFNYFATGVWNFFDHVNVNVAQALLRFHPNAII